MKKKLLPLLSIATLLGLGACDTDSNEYHTTYFYPQSYAGTVVYADQMIDSVKVVSTDKWTLNNSEAWLTVKSGTQTNNISINVPDMYVLTTRLDLSFTPNTTGQLRSTHLLVTSSFGKIGSISRSVSQRPYLNILRPDVTVSTEGEQKVYSFNLSIAGNGKTTNGTDPQIEFIIYDANATLSSGVEWITPEKTQDFVAGEKQAVKLTISANKTEAVRKGTLTLTSNGVATPIAITQAVDK